MDMRASPLIFMILSILFWIASRFVQDKKIAKKSIWKQKFYKIKKLWSKFIDFCIPPNSKKAKILNIKLKKAIKNQDIYKFFFYKLLCVIFTGILSYSIYKTNVNYSLKAGGEEVKKNIYIIITICSYWSADIFIEVFTAYKKAKYEKDLIVLKITTFLLASMGLQVKEILYYLKDLTPIYRDIFKDCISSYNSIQVGPHRAVMNMTEEVDFLHFRKLCMILRDMLTGDKKRAVRNLEIDMELEQKENEMRIAAKIDRNAMISVILIMLVMFMMLLIMLYPLLNYLRNFEMIL